MDWARSHSQRALPGPASPSRAPTGGRALSFSWGRLRRFATLETANILTTSWIPQIFPSPAICAGGEGGWRRLRRPEHRLSETLRRGRPRRRAPSRGDGVDHPALVCCDSRQFAKTHPGARARTHRERVRRPPSSQFLSGGAAPDRARGLGWERRGPPRPRAEPSAPARALACPPCAGCSACRQRNRRSWHGRRDWGVK